MPKKHIVKNTNLNFPPISMLEQLLEVNTKMLADETEHLSILEDLMKTPYIIVDEFLDETITFAKNKRKRAQKDRSEFEYWLTQNPSANHRTLLEENIVYINKIDKINQQELFLSENYKKYTGVTEMMNMLHSGYVPSVLPNFSNEDSIKIKNYIEKYHLMPSLIDIHGFFTGIVSSPYAISPVKWIEHLGIVSYDPECQHEIFDVCLALMTLYINIIKDLRNETFNVDRFFKEFNNSEIALADKEQWAFWYMDGIFLEDSKWEMDENSTPLLFTLFALGDKTNVLKKRIGADRAELLKKEAEENLSEIAIKIYSISHKESKMELPENPMFPSPQKIKQSRNALCQCDSGKKFKHCCLN